VYYVNQDVVFIRVEREVGYCSQTEAYNATTLSSLFDPRYTQLCTGENNITCMRAHLDDILV
jgi:hypothetical protein